ncbi:MAG: LytTR family DNA-binding domain-containing protein [Pseudomonadota bacterium]
MLTRLPQIKPFSDVTNQVQRLTLHPACLVVFLSVTICFFLFYADNRYSAQTTLDQFLLTFGWGAIYFSGFYTFMGRPIHFLIERGVPMVWAYYLYFTIIATLEATFGHFLFRADASLAQFGWHLVSTMFAITPAIVICGLYFEKDMRRILSHEPDHLPYWLPAPTVNDQFQTHLPEAVKGQVLLLKAANQYVEVITENGTCDLRMTLTNAIDLMGSHEGVQVHRSVWVHRSQMESLIYDRGNPRLIGIDGNRYPVSRNRVAAVRELLKAA